MTLDVSDKFNTRVKGPDLSVLGVLDFSPRPCALAQGHKIQKKILF